MSEYCLFELLRCVDYFIGLRYFVPSKCRDLVERLDFGRDVNVVLVFRDIAAIVCDEFVPSESTARPGEVHFVLFILFIMVYTV